MTKINWAAVVVVLGTLAHASVSAVLTHRALAMEPPTAVSANDRQPVLVAGTQLRGVDPGVFKSAQRSVVLVFSTECGICRSSLPFYRRMAATLATQSRAQLVVAVVDSVDSARSLLETNGVAGKLIRADASQMDIIGTPTLIICDERGRIISSWVGKLDAATEDAVLATVTDVNTQAS